MARKTTKPRTLPPVTNGNGAEHPNTNALLTSKQLQCLQAWWTLYEETGEEPGIRAVSAAMGLTDNHAAPLLRQLDKKGVFAREVLEVPGRRVLLPAGKKWLKMA